MYALPYFQIQSPLMQVKTILHSTENAIKRCDMEVVHDVNDNAGVKTLSPPRPARLRYHRYTHCIPQAVVLVTPYRELIDASLYGLVRGVDQDL